MKPRSLAWQLYPSYLFIALLVLIGLGWYFSVALRSFHYEQTAEDLASRALLIEEQLPGHLGGANQVNLSQLIQRLGEHSGTRITIILKDGTVVADSHENALKMENHGHRPEIVSALNGETGQSIRFSQTLGQTLMYVAVPLVQNDLLVGSVRTARALSDIDEALGAVYRQLFAGGFFIILLALPISWYLAHRISRPLKQMTLAAQHFSQGNFSIPLAEKGSEETSRLAKALNVMAGELSMRISREVEQRSEIEAILGCMVEGIIAVDNDERVIRLNSAAAQLFGVSHLSDTGKPIQELIRHVELHRFISRALTLQQPLEDELTFFGTEQRLLHIQAAPLTGKSEERIGVLIVLHDLTRLRQLESVRKDFVANVSHELKTPITAIRGAVETLLDEDDLNDVGQRFLQIIFKQSERLNALVEDLLDLSRIEQGDDNGGWELIQNDLLPVLESAKNGCESLLTQHQVQLEIKCPKNLQARINLALLEQAVINLLSNAIKYSGSGTQVIVSAVEQDDDVIIEVQDSGCGISAEHLPRLFERFYRIDLARSRSLGGTGLGLAIVKHVAYAHAGDVSVESVVGEGSIFRITLPQKKG